MSRNINNFEALNNQQPESKATDAASFKHEEDDEKKILDEGGIIIEGNQIEELFDRNFSVFGQGVLRTSNMSIKGERIEFDELSHNLTSSKNASVKNNDILMKGPTLQLNIDDMTGMMPYPTFTIYKGFVTAAPDRVLTVSGIGSVYNPNASKVKKDEAGELQPNSRGDADALYFL
jgi:hypothetical protein